MPLQDEGFAGGAPSESLADCLRGLRLRAGLSQDELARKAGLSVDAVSALERGTRRRPHPATVRALSEALELNGEARAALTAAAHGSVIRTRGDPPESPAEAQPSDLVGRDEDIARVCELLSRHRLVTLTGTAGVGKSRLAEAIGHSIIDRTGGELAAVPLSAIDDPDLVGPRLADALGVPWVVGGPTPQLRERLAGRPLLLVLDNFEHVLVAATLLPDLLAAAPSVRILVTSRTPLTLRDEITYEVLPLPVPFPAATSVEDLEAAPASRLLLLRLRGLQRNFPVALHVQGLAEICRQMGGLPLALELAAPALRARAPADILQHLDRFMLRQGSVDLPERHRTLEAAIDWSYRLLEPSDQTIFRRLSVFVGGFDPDDVATVVGQESALESVERLVAASLVAVRWLANGRLRYDLPAPIAAFARSRLGADEAQRTDALHATLFARTAEDLFVNLYSGAQIAALDRFDEEEGNLWAATRTAAEAADTPTAARLGWSLWVFWWLRGCREQGRALLSGILQGSLTDSDRARVIHARTALADRTAVSTSEFFAAFTEVLTLARSADDRPAEATALTGLGLLLLTDGAHNQAVGYLQQALKTAAEAGSYGRWMARQAQVFLATALSRLGRFGEAREYSLRAVEVAEHVSDTLVLTIALHTLSIAEHGLGRVEAADDHLRRAVALCESTGDADNLQHLLVTMACHELDRTDTERTVALLGAAEAMRRQAGPAVLTPHANPTATEHLREQTQQRLSERLWRDSYATGLRLDIAGACRLALAGP